MSKNCNASETTRQAQSCPTSYEPEEKGEIPARNEPGRGLKLRGATHRVTTVASPARGYSRSALQVGQYRPLVRTVELVVAKAAQHPLEPAVDPSPSLGRQNSKACAPATTSRTCSSVRTCASFMSITIASMIATAASLPAVGPSAYT